MEWQLTIFFFLDIANSQQGKFNFSFFTFRDINQIDTNIKDYNDWWLTHKVDLVL